MSFDYIIIGAGSAGCVLADRLSRDGTSTVLLLEAGGENRSLLVSMPRGMVKLWGKARYFWRFPVEPQPFRPNGEDWWYGKGLGGSSAVNGTWYYRGQPDDYDAWEAQGNEGWNWASIAAAYAEIEDYREPGADPSRGRGGPLQVTALHDKSPLMHAVREAGRQTGLAVLDDVNQPGVSGLGASQMTVDRRGKRVSAATAFLNGARRRPNLTVKTGVEVRRILFEGRRAVGVACDEGGRRQVYRAGREVTLSAGVLQSPKLLQLSGIGPAEHLRANGVAVVHDNAAVGRNMTEHMMVALSYRLNKVPGWNREFRGWRLWRHTLQYMVAGKGPMAAVLPEVSAMLSLDRNPRWPDVQLGISPFSMASSQADKPEAGRGSTEREPGLTVVAFYLRPKSRGSVEIRSGEIADPPRVRANWFTADGDRELLVKMIKEIRRFVRQPALADYVGEETVPGPQVATDDQIMTAAEWMLSTGLHGTGTCRMGPRQDAGEGSVVDPRLRVHGVRGLRVVDCSVMPTGISGNTNGPAMAVAWHAASLILEDRDATAPAASVEA